MDTAITGPIPTPSHRNKGIPIESIIKYADQGLTHSEIARMLGCDKSNITKRLQAIGYEGDSLKDFKAARADIFALGQHKIIKGITDSDIKSASLLQKATSVGILFDKEQQIRGKVGNATADSISALVELVDKVTKLASPPQTKIDDPIDVSPHPADQESE